MKYFSKQMVKFSKQKIWRREAVKDYRIKRDYN